MAVKLCGMEALVPFFAMVIAMVAQVSTLEINKIAMSNGTNRYVMVVYSYAFALLILIPSSFILHRLDRPLLNFSLLCKFFLLSVFGSSAEIFGYAGLQYSSATLATAMLNLIPAFTFMLAIIFRLERLDWRNKSNILKFLGTIISVGGAFVVTFYKGPILLGITPQISWMIGGFFLAAQAFMFSSLFILQAFVVKDFPFILIILCFDIFFAAILSAIFASAVVKDTSAWILRPDVGLFAVLYTGVIGNAFRISLSLWCVKKAGPLYVAMFKPLAVVLAVIVDFSFLKDVLSLGSLLGVIIIVAGFYMVLWGKSKEEITGKDNCQGNKTPLLRNRTEDV